MPNAKTRETKQLAVAKLVEPAKANLTARPSARKARAIEAHNAKDPLLRD